MVATDDNKIPLKAENIRTALILPNASYDLSTSTSAEN